VPRSEVAESSVALARNAFHLVLGQIGSTALSIVLNAALARSLGVADFGLLYLVTSISTFAYVFVEWGQAVYLIREVARRPEKVGELLGTSITFRVVGAAVVCALSVPMTWLLGYGLRTRQLSAILIAASLPLFLAQAYSLVFRGRERMEYDAVLTVMGKVLTLAITLAALAAGGRLLAVILAQGASGAGALGVAILLLRRLRLPPLRATSEMARELVLGGTPFVAMALTITAQPYIDAIVISKLAPPAAIGWYGAAKSIINALITPAVILAVASFPRLSRAASQPAQFNREVRAAMRPLLGVGMLGAVGTYLFANVAVTVVYGQEKFGPAVTLLQFFAPALLLFFIDVLLGSAIVAAGKAKQLAVAKVLVILPTTVLDVVLVPLCQARFGNGGLGLVLAFAGGELMMVGAALLLVPRGMLERGLLIDAGRALLAGAGTLLLMGRLPQMSPILGIPGCVLAFAALSVTVGLVDRTDMALLGTLLRKRRA
jgi:PST family polysaccharide transporter